VGTLLAEADNVRAALLLVARGEAPFGIVYASDAAASEHVAIAAMFPEHTHPPIVYPAAMTRASARNELARAFLAFLSSNKASALFERHGFRAIAAAPAG